MKLTAQQQLVMNKVEAFVRSQASVFILRGYAGTGKTTLIKEIVNSVGRQVMLMAPTGRAARVLQEKTGHVATTIHKAIYEKPSLETKDADDVASSDYKLHFDIATHTDRV